MSLVPETWGVIASGTENGVPTVVVSREKVDRERRITTWKLKRIKDAWRVVEIMFSQVNPGLDEDPVRLKRYGNGIRLSHNHIDQKLLSFCEASLATN
jgi:hypothetical protein